MYFEAVSVGSPRICFEGYNGTIIGKFTVGETSSISIFSKKLGQWIEYCGIEVSWPCPSK